MEKLKVHLKVFGYAVIFGLGAYAAIHLLLWVLKQT